MAKTFSDLQDKQQTHIKIGNFYIKKKTFTILIIVLIVAVIMIKYNNAQKEKEKQERLLAAQAMEVTNTEVEEQKYISLHDQIQMQLCEQYGQPPEGFEWAYDGSLVTLSTLEDMTAEDIVYTYVQSVHMLDFATAQRVASSSTIIDTYTDYYDSVTSALLDIDDVFKRKEFKLALNKMSADRVVDFVVMANGDMIYTMEISCLDLTNKDFWLNEEQEIYDTMYVYDKTELDSTKKEQFVYDYIYKAYEDDKCGYHTVQVDIVLTKANGGGWLVSDDTELRKVLLYEYGIDVYSYIMSKYEDWLMDYEMGGISGGSGYSVTVPGEAQENLFKSHDDLYQGNDDKLEIDNEDLEQILDKLGVEGESVTEEQPELDSETSEPLNQEKDYGVKDLSGRTTEEVKNMQERNKEGHGVDSGYSVTTPN